MNSVLSFLWPIGAEKLIRAIQEAGGIEGWAIGVGVSQDPTPHRSIVPMTDQSIFAIYPEPTQESRKEYSRFFLCLQLSLLKKREAEACEGLRIEAFLYPGWTRRGLIWNRACEWLFLAGTLTIFLTTVVFVVNFLFFSLNIWLSIDVWIPAAMTIISMFLALIATRLGPSFPPAKLLDPKKMKENLSSYAPFSIESPNSLLVRNNQIATTAAVNQNCRLYLYFSKIKKGRPLLDRPLALYFRP